MSSCAPNLLRNKGYAIVLHNQCSSTEWVNSVSIKYFRVRELIGWLSVKDSYTENLADSNPWLGVYHSVGIATATPAERKRLHNINFLS